MWEPVICTGKGLAVMVANFLTGLVMVLMVVGIPVVSICWIGDVLERNIPRVARRFADVTKVGAFTLLGCIAIAILLTLAYSTGQEICAKGWREVYLLTAKENRR